MSNMKAVVLHEEKNIESLKLSDVARPVPGPDEVLVQLKASALNHRDVWITQGLYPGIRVPIILGSDGAGIVREVGKAVDPGRAGNAVVINPGMDWGGDPRVQQSAYRILGLPDNGTQAEYLCVPAVNVVEKPAYLSFAAAAAIPLAGLTGYRALFRQGKLRKGETVLLTGIGGGVAALMMRMALAAGAKVLVTSGSDDKIRRAAAAGASGGANYRRENWGEEIGALAGENGIDLIVDSAGGEGFDTLTSLVRPGGRLVFFGATAGNPPRINLRKIFWKQLTLQGTTMGNERDFAEMVGFFARHRIEPIIDGPYPLRDFRSAYQRMIDGEQYGKIVLLNEEV